MESLASAISMIAMKLIGLVFIICMVIWVYDIRNILRDIRDKLEMDSTIDLYKINDGPRQDGVDVVQAVTG